MTGKRVLLAAEKGHCFELAQRIWEDPTLVNYADLDGYTALHRASYGGHIDCAKFLVRHGANIEAETNEHWRPLHCAVRWNNVEVAEYLVKQGADINATSTGDNTPLHIVASNGPYRVTMDIIQLLLYQPNCDCSIKNHAGETAFDLARRSGPFSRLWTGVTTIFPHKDGENLEEQDD